VAWKTNGVGLACCHCSIFIAQTFKHTYYGKGLVILVKRVRILVKSFGLVRVLVAAGSVPVVFILGFKAWLGELGYLLLSPSPVFTLSVDLSQAVLGAAMFRITLLLFIDIGGLFVGKVRASVLGSKVQPYEEPLTEMQQLAVNLGSTIFLVLCFYAPTAAMYFFAIVVGWLIASSFRGSSIVDPSNVGLSKKAYKWNTKMLLLSLISVAWGFAFLVGYSRAEKLANSSEVTVSVDGVEKNLAVMLPVPDGVIFFDREVGKPIFVTTSSISYVQPKRTALELSKERLD